MPNKINVNSTFDTKNIMKQGYNVSSSTFQLARNIEQLSIDGETIETVDELYYIRSVQTRRTALKLGSNNNKVRNIFGMINNIWK